MATFGLILSELDNLIINNYWRKFATYKEVGWDDNSIHSYLQQKDKIMQIASFNTPTVSFSASSRRNRFYEIYNRLDMLEKDVAWEGSVEAMKKLSSKYEIYVVSSRTFDLQAKTLEVMKNLGFPLEKMTILFKETNAILHSYRKDCILKVKEKFPTGVAVCITPDEGAIFENFDYTSVGFTSLKNNPDFNGKIKIVFEDWDQLTNSLMSA